MEMEDGRTRHYGDFYASPGTDSACGPLVLVWGNCQAEALRTLVSSAQDTPYATIRIPPVHELTAADLPHVERVMRRARVVVSQPVRSGYRSLPIGTDDLRRWLPARAQIIRWPVIRYAGLHPFQVIVRHPDTPAAVPDGAPYHDLRTILAAHHRRPATAEWDVAVTAEALRAAAQLSIDELVRRERRDTDIPVSDALIAAGRDAVHTINHPGNPVLIALAERVLAALGGDEPVAAPDRDLLGSVRAPVEQRVLDALGLPGPAITHWRVEGIERDPDTVHRVQMRWYAEHPEFIDAALTRHAERIDILGLGA